MSENEEDDIPNGINLSYRQMKWAAAGYMIGGLTYVIHECNQADLSLSKSAIVATLSLFGCIIVPTVAALTGNQLGRVAGALIGTVAKIGYAFTPKQARKERSNDFRRNAIMACKTLGLAAGLITGLWVAREGVGIIIEEVRDYHGNTRKSNGFSYIAPALEKNGASTTAFYPVLS